MGKTRDLFKKIRDTKGTFPEKNFKGAILNIFKNLKEQFKGLTAKYFNLKNEKTIKQKRYLKKL